MRDMVLHHISRRANTPTAVGVCAPYEVTSQMAIYRYKRSALVDFIIERPLFPSDWARACCDWLVQSHNRTATRVPTRPVVDSLSLR